MVKSYEHNHELIWKAIFDLETRFRSEFSVSELYEHILKTHGSIVISRTRLRTHLDGYVSPGKAKPLPECKSFLSEGKLKLVGEKRNLRFRVIHSKEESELSELILRNASFYRWAYDPGIRPYESPPLLCTYYVNFPPKALPGTPFVSEKKGIPQGTIESGFFNYLLRRLLYAYITDFDTLIKGEVKKGYHKLGITEYLLVRKKKRFPKRGLTTFVKWLNLAKGQKGQYEQKILFGIRIDLQRIIELLQTDTGARYLLEGAIDKEFRKSLRYSLAEDRDVSRMLKRIGE